MLVRVALPEPFTRHNKHLLQYNDDGSAIPGQESIFVITTPQSYNTHVKEASVQENRSIIRTESRYTAYNARELRLVSKVGKFLADWSVRVMLTYT